MSERSDNFSNLTSIPHYDEQDNISLTDIMLTLARNTKVIIITPTILCSLMIIYVSFIAKPIYTSTSKIMSSSNTGGITQAAGLAAQFGIALPAGQSEQKWAYPEIIKSRTLARSMIKKKFDTNQFGSQKSLMQILTYGNDKPEVGLDTLEIKAVDNFLKMIDVSESKMTGILTLNIHASEPSLAAKLNKSLVEALDEHQKKYNKAKTSDTRKFIEGRILDTEKELMAAEENLKVFMARNRRIENSPALQLEEQRLSREVAVLTGVFTTLKQQLETTKIEEVKESDYVIVLDKPEIPLMRSKPKKKELVVLAGVIGIGIGILIAFFRKFVSKIEKDDKKKISEARNLALKTIYELIPGKSNK
tara:strand:+ start:2653 stop:3738 length:1086 start_codon:yes stop_codon:yes gene_type:complete